MDEATNAFVVTTQTSYKKGEQVFVDAGNYNNIILLLNRGYVFEDKEYNAAIVNVQLTEEDVYSASKFRILNEAGLQV